MLLVIDVGNTNIVLGVFKEKKILNRWRMTTALNRTADEMAMSIQAFFQNTGLDYNNVKDVIISSVVPDIMYSITHAIKKYFKITPLIVTHKLKTGIKICMDNPGEVGADRIVNCAGAYHLYGGPLIVIDYGTATTYDVVTEEGSFVAGVTAPGIRICADALFTRAALLGKVELTVPKSVMAANTVESVQAGIAFSHIGETEYIVRRLKREMNNENIKIIATGGLSKIIAEGSDTLEIVNPTLTLEGLMIIYEMNR